MARIWLCADASRRTGVGHVKRTLALAERARDVGLDVRYLTVRGGLGETIVLASGFQSTPVAGPTDGAWLSAVAEDDIVVFDGYDYPPSLMRAAQNRACRTGAVVDHPSGRFDVDVLLNQNIVEAHSYVVADRTTLLFGPRFALIRGEFRGSWRPGLATLTVTLGGGDKRKTLSVIIDRLSDGHPFETVRLLVGPGTDVPSVSSDFEIVCDPPHVAAAFLSSAAVLSAGGSTIWELLALGVPTAAIQTEDNQELVVRPLAQRGVVVFAGDLTRSHELEPGVLDTLADPSRQVELSAKGRQLVDGRGAERFLEVLTRR